MCTSAFKGALVLLLLLAAGCASHPPAGSVAEPADKTCERLYRELDEMTTRSGHRDAATARVPGYPYLRADRFLASLKDRAPDGPAFDAWVERLRGLDVTARGYEWANFAQPDKDVLVARFAQLREGPTLVVQECGRSLAKRDLGGDRARAELRAKVTVPDDYADWKRAVGIYPLTRIAFASGIRRYQAQTTNVFEQELAQLPVHGQLRVYAPQSSAQLSATQVREIISRSRADALGIPELEASDLEKLFDVFAPAYWIDEVDDNDRIGTLRLDAHGRAEVDTAQPVVYRRLTYTRYDGQIWPQLVYSVWLPSRPKTGTLDLLGGHLDGITWRVTLGPDGSPVLYDSIHNCGCYHQFFPTERMALKPQPDTLDETAFVPQRAPTLKPGERVLLRIAARTHYIERVVTTPDPERSIPYAVAPDDTLRSLSMPSGGRRSAFRDDGIVPGSERGERWLFWPTGVREPGAMREWGRHATAFVGKRHFDDPGLTERYFELVP